MSLVANFSLPIDDFVLGDALARDGVERVEFDCTIPARTDAMPYFRAWGSRFDEFVSAVEDEPAVENVALIDEFDGGNLYRAEWRSDVPSLLEATRQSEGTLREVRGDSRWRFELLFERRADLTAFTGFYADVDGGLRLERIRTLRDPFGDGYDLTAKQRETLVTAERRGYFSEPRALTMAELAGVLEVSPAAVSGRLRRGFSRLIQHTLL
ncbi:MAG: helix-turn-helix domain-containing protein [Salinigranum sp.]